MLIQSLKLHSVTKQRTNWKDKLSKRIEIKKIYIYIDGIENASQTTDHPLSASVREFLYFEKRTVSIIFVRDHFIHPTIVLFYH